ncbi:transposase, mutator family [Sesbania bispinosa]|nr:transposase, mutator family [Sesbania bispinosa]
MESEREGSKLERKERATEEFTPSLSFPPAVNRTLLVVPPTTTLPAATRRSVPHRRGKHHNSAVGVSETGEGF